MARPLTREAELRTAIVDADLPPRDRVVLMVFMKRATWVTAKIKDEFQPRSLEELARWAHMSEANVKRSLNHLQRHGWVQRYRHLSDKGIGGRGHGTHYQLDHGRDCDCPGLKCGEPMTGAERTRRWRERKANAKQAVSTLLPGDGTLPSGHAVSNGVSHGVAGVQPIAGRKLIAPQEGTANPSPYPPESLMRPSGEPRESPAKGAQAEPLSLAKGAHGDVTKRLSDSHTSAGHAPVPAKSVRDEEGVGERAAFAAVWDLPRPAPDESWKSWPAGSIGEWENR